MGEIITRKKRVIKFTNTKAARVGIGIKVLRQQSHLSLKQLADKAKITENYLNLLEEGHEPKIDPEVLRNIAEAVGVCKRGNVLTDEKLVDIFLYAASQVPPKLF